MVEQGGKMKKVGSYFKEGENMAGSWSINNNFNVVKEALINYLLYGTDPEKLFPKIIKYLTIK